MTIVVKAEELRAGGYGETAPVSKKFDYAARHNDDLALGARESARANKIMAQVQVGYKHPALAQYDVVLIDVRRFETTWSRVVISVYQDGKMAYSMATAGRSLEDCVLHIGKRLTIV